MDAVSPPTSPAAISAEEKAATVKRTEPMMKRMSPATIEASGGSGSAEVCSVTVRPNQGTERISLEEGSAGA
eukprot:3713805-Pleurochrysis_carterae.AAC.1